MRESHAHKIVQYTQIITINLTAAASQARNNIWLKKYPWFASETLPELQTQVKRALE